MLRDLSPIAQTFAGTLFTWGLTGAGAALVFIISSQQQKVLDGSLGFAAGVMIAASYWSLLKPAIEIATDSHNYGAEGEFAIFPVAFGFLLGSLFVYLADIYLPYFGDKAPKIILSSDLEPHLRKNGMNFGHADPVQENRSLNFSVPINNTIFDGLRRRQMNSGNIFEEAGVYQLPSSEPVSQVRWKRILLLMVAITVHNIPEGLAVGVGFGAVNKTKSATFENARNLAIGIGIQNFPEGLAVSLPLHAAGMSKWRSFWYGQLSGLVEPIAGLFGCFAVTLAEPLLPYALSFAAGAMIYVVVDDIIPEAQMNGNGKLASWLTIVGFIVMMVLDVSLG